MPELLSMVLLPPCWQSCLEFSFICLLPDLGSLWEGLGRGAPLLQAEARMKDLGLGALCLHKCQVMIGIGMCIYGSRKMARVSLFISK